MSDNPRFKKRLYASAVALGLAVGSVGIAAAATGGSPDSATSEDTTEVQEPTYTGSIQAPAEDESQSEADEAAQLAPLATISADDAAAAASAVVPGDVGKVELDNENGAVVYSVEITDTTGGETDIKVDAGDGTILNQQTDDGDGEADNEADEVDNDDVEDEDGLGGYTGTEAEDIRDD